MLAGALLVLGCLAPGRAFAQTTGEVTARPGEPELRLIWIIKGDPAGLTEIGEGVGGLGDIYGTGKGAWAVLHGQRDEWMIFRNDSDNIRKDTVPVQRFIGPYGSVWPHPVVGDFWGDGHKGIGFGGADLDTSTGREKWYFRLDIRRVEGNRIADSVAAKVTTRTVMPLEADPQTIMVADLNGDGADELIFVRGGGIRLTYPEFWIYKGGPDFRPDSPTVIVAHPMSQNFQGGVRATLGDFDGDRHPDIVLSRTDNAFDDPDTLDHLTFYWGDGTLEGYADTNNRRVIRTTRATHPSAFLPLVSLDCDGDSVSDLALTAYFGTAEQHGVYLYRSKTERHARTRSYQLDDADVFFAGSSWAAEGGFLNDATRRYQMLAIPQRNHTKFFSGGPDGPDHAYDAHINYAYGYGRPIPDADGDGWDDYLGGDPDDNGILTGFAAVYAGGPYIPRDTATSNVDMIVTGERQDAITIWPNPVHDELNIAWRGDMRRMPSRFRVHDGLGREVAAGTVAAWRGAAIWRCADAPSGIYLLSIYDESGVLIATTRLVKH